MGSGEGERETEGLMMNTKLVLEKTKLEFMAGCGVSHSVKEFGNTYAY